MIVALTLGLSCSRPARPQGRLARREDITRRWLRISAPAAYAPRPNDTPRSFRGNMQPPASVLNAATVWESPRTTPSTAQIRFSAALPTGDCWTVPTNIVVPRRTGAGAPARATATVATGLWGILRFASVFSPRADRFGDLSRPAQFFTYWLAIFARNDTLNRRAQVQQYRDRG